MQGAYYLERMVEEWIVIGCLAHASTDASYGLYCIPPAHRGWHGNGLATQYDGPQGIKPCEPVRGCPQPQPREVAGHGIYSHERVSLWHTKPEKQHTQVPSTAEGPIGDQSETRSWKATHFDGVKQSAECVMRSSCSKRQKKLGWQTELE